MRKYVDIPVFVLANVAVDVEPLATIVFRLDYALHGYCHTFLIGSLVGVAWGVAAYLGRDILKMFMHQLLRLPYEPGFLKMVVSGVLGVWFHVLLDSPLYGDIRPFFPSNVNPMYGLATATTVYGLCVMSLVPAVILYVAAVLSFLSRKQ